MDFAVIMAGGTGKRLWPLSRETRPKQVLKILNGETLLRQCYERLSPIFDSRNILVLTNAGYCDLVREALPEVPFGNVIAEPAVRDTMGAIALAAGVLDKFSPQATMAVVTADQIIEPAEVLQGAISDGLTFVNANPQSLVTFGIKPNFPSTQLGYIKLADACKAKGCKNSICPVDSFKEKPDVETAQKYVDSGQYYWNSGMFVWKASKILDLIYNNVPQTKPIIHKIQASWQTSAQERTLREEFIKLPKISIDYAVMEKAADVYAIRLDCRWLDMGSFAALADIINSDKNNNIVVAGSSELLDCKDSIFITEDNNHLIAAIGLKNMIVAHSPDATLVCPLDDTQRIKELLAIIEQRKGNRYL